MGALVGPNLDCPWTLEMSGTAGDSGPPFPVVQREAMG